MGETLQISRVLIGSEVNTDVTLTEISELDRENIFSL